MLNFYLSALETEKERNRMTEIYEEYNDMFLLFALKILKNQELAEDAVHNTFIEIIEGKDKFFNMDNKDFKFLAFTIVKYQSINILRKQKRYSHIPIEELDIHLESDDMPLDEQIIFTSEYEAIKNLLMKVDVISRQVLEMRYVHGMSHKDIGQALNMTAKHVNTRIMRAKQKIRKLLKNDKAGIYGK